VGLFFVSEAAKSLQKTERAARQQGSSFLRENSSNGGKTIRTFWLHSRCGRRECQGEIEAEINYLISITYKTSFRKSTEAVFDASSPFPCRKPPSFYLVL
jgi:hypothetical protein